MKKNTEDCGQSTLSHDGAFFFISTVTSIASQFNFSLIFSSPELMAHKVSLWDGRRAGVRPSVRACTRASVRVLTLSNTNISATSGPIATKFYLKHQWGGGKAALGFWPDRIGNLVSMATDSSHRVIMGKISLAL